MNVWTKWRRERTHARRAHAYAAVLQREPADEDVRWLARHAANGDADHARWELRYARRALGLLAAQRDALDDRTASAVAHALGASLAADRNVAAAKREVAERQFNARLTSYSAILAHREGREPTAARLGRALLGFAGAASSADAVARAGEILAGYLAESNEALRSQFGAVDLPENVAPSALAGHSNE